MPTHPSTNKKSIAKAYISHLAAGDLASLLALFAENGIVVSPVYGTQDYTTFYTKLFADTQDSILEVKGIFEDTDSGHLALHFTYQWTLKDKSFVQFEVVDILVFNEMDQIEKLTIIYDTVRSRGLVAGLEGK